MSNHPTLSDYKRKTAEAEFVIGADM